jgi:hypothetical protein
VFLLLLIGLALEDQRAHAVGDLGALQALQGDLVGRVLFQRGLEGGERAGLVAGGHGLERRAHVFVHKILQRLLGPVEGGEGVVELLLGGGEAAVEVELAAGAGGGERRLEFQRGQRAGAVELAHAGQHLVVGFLRALLQLHVLAEGVDLAAQGGEVRVGRAVVATLQQELAVEEGFFDEDELVQLALVVLREAADLGEGLGHVFAGEARLGFADEDLARVGLIHRLDGGGRAEELVADDEADAADDQPGENEQPERAAEGPSHDAEQGPGLGAVGSSVIRVPMNYPTFPVVGGIR